MDQWWNLAAPEAARTDEQRGREQAQGTVRQIESLQLRRDAAHRRHLAAIKALAETRRLLQTSPPRKTASKAVVKGSGGARGRAARAATAPGAAWPVTISMKSR